MNTICIIGFFLTIFYFLVQFEREESLQEVYEEVLIDVEGRLDWARTRKTFPFGMKAQLDVACELLGKAKDLWRENKWKQAYRVSLQSQMAMDKAQNIYSAVVNSRREKSTF